MDTGLSPSNGGACGDAVLFGGGGNGGNGGNGPTLGDPGPGGSGGLLGVDRDSRFAVAHERPQCLFSRCNAL